MDNTAQRIKKMLEGSGKTQKELAAYIGVSENGLSGMMKSGRFKHHNMIKIAKFFSVDLSLFNSESPYKPSLATDNQEGSYDTKMVESLQEQIQILERLISEKDRTIAAKDEVIATLREKLSK